MSQRSPDEERGEPTYEPLPTRTPPRKRLGLVTELPARTSGGPHHEKTPNFDMTSSHDSGSRDNDVHEELARIKQENAQLNEALRSRTVLGQATGFLMAELHLSPDEAFAALTTLSSYANRKVRDIAADVVAAANVSRARERAHPAALPELLRLLPKIWPDQPRSGVRRNRVVRAGEDAP